MWEDPIVAEVHRAREKLAADCNYDIRAFFAGLRERQLLNQRAETATESRQSRHPDSTEATSSKAGPAA